MPIYSVQGPDGRIYDVEGPDGASEADIIGAVRRHLAQQQQTPKEDTTGFKAAAAAGLESLKGQTALTAGKLGLMDEQAAEQYYREREQAAKARFTPTEQGWTEAPWLKFKETLGGSLPYMAAPVVAGAAAVAAPVSAPTAALIGAGAAGLANFGQFVGSNLGRQMEPEGTKLADTSLGAAAAAAAPQALLDTAAMALMPGVGKLFGSVGSKLSVQEARAIADQTVRQAVADYAKSAGATMTREGVTEAIQQVLERAQAGLSISDPEARKEYIDSFIGGAALGGAGAPFGRAFERSGAQKVVQEDDERIAKEQADAQEAARSTPEALRQLSSDYQQAELARKQLDDLIKSSKPGKDATDEQKAEYQALKDQRKEFINNVFLPLKQEYKQREDAITQMYEQEQAAAETAAAPQQQAATAAIPNEPPRLDVQRLMLDQDALRRELGGIEEQLAGAQPEQFDALNTKRQELQKRIDARATLIEEMGGSPLAQSEFEQATAAKMQAFDTQLEKLNTNYATALENKDYDAAAKAKDALLSLRQERNDFSQKVATQMAALQEKQMGLTQRGQTRDLFAEMPEQPQVPEAPQVPGAPAVATPQASGLTYVRAATSADGTKKAGEKIEPFAATAAEATPFEPAKPAEVESIKAAQDRVAAAQAKLDEVLGKRQQFELEVPEVPAAPEVKGAPQAPATPEAAKAEPVSAQETERARMEAERKKRRPFLIVPEEPPKPPRVPNAELMRTLGQQVRTSQQKLQVARVAAQKAVFTKNPTIIRETETRLKEVMAEHRQVLADAKAAAQAAAQTSAAPTTPAAPQAPATTAAAEVSVRPFPTPAEEPAAPAAPAEPAKRTTTVSGPQREALYQALDELNQAQDAASRVAGSVANKQKKPVVLDLFSPANVIRTAIENRDEKLLKNLGVYSTRKQLIDALDAKSTERTSLIKALDERLGLGGTDASTAPGDRKNGKKTGEPLQSVKRERVPIFEQLFTDPAERESFVNGTNQRFIERPRMETVQEFQRNKRGAVVMGGDNKPVVTREYQRPVIGADGRPVMDKIPLQDIYDQGGESAVEYEYIMDQIEQIARKVTSPQGNAKKSLHEQLLNTHAELEELKQRMESGVATPTMREKVATLGAKLGKGEAPAERQMDASERYNLQRKITSAQNRYDALVAKITPVRDEILNLYGSMFGVTRDLPKVSQAREAAATQAAEERSAQANAVREGTAKTAIPRSVKTAARIESGNVRKEAETSEEMRTLATELGQQAPDYQTRKKAIEKRIKALKDRYGPNDSAVTSFRINSDNELEKLGIKLGKQTPEYKAKLKEKIEYFRSVLPTAGTQEAKSERTPQVTRTQSSAPKRLRTSTPESLAEAAKETARAPRKRERPSMLRGVEVESVALSTGAVDALKKNDLRAALGMVATDTRVDAFSRAVAKRLLDFLDVTKVEVVGDLRAPDGQEVYGAATSKLVQINSNGGLSVEVLLHESTHAAAERVVQLAETNPDALTREQKIAIQELKALHARVKSDAGITSKNAKSSLSEFVAEVMSNRNLQRQLAERKWRMSDMWQGIKSVIMRMLGLQQVETMFGASAVAVEQLFIPASSVTGLGRTETVVNRKLSAKDIAALHDGSNSMKQFADQFGTLIKQKDRTPEDVERIASGYISDMVNNTDKYLALPTADTLDYDSLTTMSDGKQFDADNPLHYVEADAATFAAIKAKNDKSLRAREAEGISNQRREAFTNLIGYLSDNYNNYTAAELALVLKAASKWAVLGDSKGKLRLAEMTPTNRHNVAVVGKEGVDAVIEQLRAGKGLKQAFLDGMQKYSDDNARKNEGKNGWKKFNQAKAGENSTISSLYTEEEIHDAFGNTGYDGAQFETDDELVERLIEDGLLPDRRDQLKGGDALEKAAIELNAGASGTSWCTGSTSLDYARSQIKGGDFYIYYDNGRPEVAVRMNGSDTVVEIRGNTPNQALTKAQQQIAQDFLVSQNFNNSDKYLSEIKRREVLKKLLSDPGYSDYKELLSLGKIVSFREVQDYTIRELLDFSNFGGYGRTRPTDAVQEKTRERVIGTIKKAYASNNFIGAEVEFRLGETTTEVEFHGDKYIADASTVESAANVTVRSARYGYSGNRNDVLVLPKLVEANKLHALSSVYAPKLAKVEQLISFTSRNEVLAVSVSPDATIGTLENYQSEGTLILHGGTTVATIKEPTKGGVIIAPDVKYARVRYAQGPELLEAATDEVADFVRDKIREADSNTDYSVLRKAYKDLSLDAKKAFKQAMIAAANAFDIKNYNIVSEDFFDENKKVNELVGGFMGEYAGDHVRADMFALNSKLNTALGLRYGKLAETGGVVETPSKVADTPYADELTEAPERVRFAPKPKDGEKATPSFASRQKSQFSSVGREPGVINNLMGNIMGLAGRVQFIDQYAALEEATRKGLSKGIISDLEATNANYLLRFGQQRSQFAGQFLTNGPVKAVHTKKNGGVETIYRSTKGVSMMDVAKELNKAGISNDAEREDMFTMYLAGQRAKQVGWEKLNFADPKKAKADYDAVMARLSGNQKATDAFNEATKLYQKYNAGLLDFLVDTGVMSAKKAAELKSITYVPFYRINNNGEVQLMIDKEHPVRISNIKDQPQLQELIGGNTAILPVFTSAAQNTFMLTGMGLRNQAVKETSFMLRKLGMASRIGEGKGPKGSDVVRFFRNGVEHYAVIDEDVFGVPAELVVRGMEGIKTTLPAVVKLMGMPADILRSFVVRNPVYALRQAIRDPLNAWLLTGTDATPVLSSMKELAKMVAGRSETERKLTETGAISSNVFTGDERDMTKFLRELSSGKIGWSMAMAKADALAMQGDASTRAVIYNDSLKKGMSEQEALLRTLESMNFSRRGVSPSMHALSVMIPFFNAQVQGLDVIYRALKGDMPYSKQLEIRRKLLTRGALLAAGTIAYAMMMEDDEAYKRARPEERYANWFVYVPGFNEPVRVPIPFEMGFLFKALPEAVLNVAFQDDRADRALKGLGKMAMQSNPFSLPQAVKPLTEAVLGRSFYGGDIESQREREQMLATERYRDSTTEVAKIIGSVTGEVGISPLMIDHLIRGYTAGLGIALVQLANPLLAPSRADVPEPTKPASRTPVVGGLFQPVEGRGTIDEAYDRMKDIQQTKGTFNAMVEKGQAAEARAFAQRYADRLAAMSTSGRVQQRLGELAAMERKVRASPTMTTEQKDKVLAQIDRAKMAYAEGFLKATD